MASYPAAFISSKTLLPLVSMEKGCPWVASPASSSRLLGVLFLMVVTWARLKASLIIEACMSLVW